MKVRDKFILNSVNGKKYDCDIVNISDYREPEMKYLLDIYIGDMYIGEKFVGDSFFIDNADKIEIKEEKMSKKINTIQKRENLNEVFAEGEKGNGGAYHKYAITYDSNGDGYIRNHGISFQDGPRKINGSTNGIIDTDLLEIVRHRLQCFQEGLFATRENAVALTHIEEALMWMNRRVEDRIERNVLGKNKK